MSVLMKVDVRFARSPVHRSGCDLTVVSVQVTKVVLHPVLSLSTVTLLDLVIPNRDGFRAAQQLPYGHQSWAWFPSCLCQWG